MHPTQDITVEQRIRLTELARLGREAGNFLESDSLRMARQMATGQIFEGWVSSVSVTERENLHAEQKAMERVFDALRDIHQEGIVAQEALKRLNEEAAILADDEVID